MRLGMIGRLWMDDMIYSIVSTSHGFYEDVHKCIMHNPIVLPFMIMTCFKSALCLSFAP